MSTQVAKVNVPMPIWLDCDPGNKRDIPIHYFTVLQKYKQWLKNVIWKPTGHDDAFAMLLASTNPSFDLLGISTIHGNASLEKTTNNALSLLTAMGQHRVPVYAGAKKPYMRPAVHAPDIHGTTLSVLPIHSFS